MEICRFFILLILVSCAHCIRNADFIHSRRVDNRAQVSLQIVGDNDVIRVTGANLIHSNFVLSSIAFLQKCRSYQIYARIGSLGSFQGGALREVIDCKMFQHFKVEDDRMSMIVGQLATPYRSASTFEMGFMAYTPYRPRHVDQYTGKKQNYLVSGWYGDDYNEAGQTLSGMLVHEMHPKFCEKWYNGVGRYTIVKDRKQPMGCYAANWCGECAPNIHPMERDEGNGLYYYSTNLLLGVVQTSIKSKHWNRPVITSFVENIRNDVVPHMIRLMVDEQADFPEFDLERGIF